MELNPGHDNSYDYASRLNPLRSSSIFLVISFRCPDIKFKATAVTPVLVRSKHWHKKMDRSFNESTRKFMQMRKRRQTIRFNEQIENNALHV